MSVNNAIRSVFKLLENDELSDYLIQIWPKIEEHVTKLVLLATEGLFSPRLMIRQLLLAVALQTGLASITSVGVFTEKILRRLTVKGRERNTIEERMKKAKTYVEWKRSAEELDALSNLDKWRLEDSSLMYDVRTLKKRMDDIMFMLNSEEVFNMIYRLRGALSRDQFGMTQPRLFNCAAGGTKIIVEEYAHLLSSCLDYICDHDDPEVPDGMKLAFFNETRHSYGRTALLLSGGAALASYHLGVIKTLFEQGLLPRIISGASAGSFIAAIIGIRDDDELRELLYAKSPEDFLRAGLRMDFFNIKKQHDEHETKMLFYYLIPPFLRPIFDALIGHFFMSKPLLQLDTDHLKDVFIKNMGMLTFQEAFDKTGRIINITVAPNNSYDPPRLLNYLTAPHICIWSAAVASCAIPGVFESVPLVVKEPTGEFHPENEWVRKRNCKEYGDLVVYSDGSVERDLPMQQISELFNVNHFIVSQVNPHSALLSTLTYNTEGYAIVVGYLRYLKALFRHWISDVIEYFAYTSREGSWGARRSSPFGISTAILTQDYEGRESDVTIMPWKGALSIPGAFMQVIHNITNSELLGMIHSGCKNTWPELARIRTQIGVEMTLDKCVQRLRRRISQQHPVLSSRSTVHKTTVELFSGLSVIDTTLNVDYFEDKIKDNTMIERGRSTSDFEDLEQMQSNRTFDDMETCELSTSSVKLLLPGVSNTCPLPSKKAGSSIAERFNRQSDNRRKSISAVDLKDLYEFKELEDVEEAAVHKLTMPPRKASFYYKNDRSSSSNTLSLLDAESMYFSS